MYELLFGPKYAGYNREIEDVKSFILWVRVLPFNEKATEMAVDIDGVFYKEGKRMDLRDIFIVVTCIVYDAKIVTYNVSHFKIISSEIEYELSVITPNRSIEGV